MCRRPSAATEQCFGPDHPHAYSNLGYATKHKVQVPAVDGAFDTTIHETRRCSVNNTVGQNVIQSLLAPNQGKVGVPRLKRVEQLQQALVRRYHDRDAQHQRAYVALVIRVEDDQLFYLCCC